MGRRISQFMYKKFSTILENQPKKAEEPKKKEEENALPEELPPRFLYPKDPNKPRVTLMFNYLTNEALKKELVPQLAVHFEYEGNTILKDSEEFKQQEDIQEERKKKIMQVIEKH